MDWLHETYRRLYVRADARWLALPATTRGLADELIRVADDDGHLPLGEGETLFETVCRIVSAQKWERSVIKRAIELLLKDGFLIIDPGTQSGAIRNFVAAQGLDPKPPTERTIERNAAAIRQARHRAKVREERDVTRDVTRDSNATSPVTSRGGGDARPREGGRACVPSVPSVPSNPPPPESSSADGDGGEWDPEEAERETPQEIPAHPPIPATAPGVGVASAPVPLPLPPPPASPALLTALGSSEELRAERVSLVALAKQLEADALPGGWAGVRLVEATRYAVDALALARLTSGRLTAGGGAFIVRTVRRVARPRVLEAELAKSTRTPPVEPEGVSPNDARIFRELEAAKRRGGGGFYGGSNAT